MAYHHFQDILAMTKILAFFLKPGGSLLVADFQTNDTEGHVGATAIADSKWKHIVAHTGGFSNEVMKNTIEGAGLIEFTIEHSIKAKGMGAQEVNIFLAKGVKPEGIT